MRERICLITVVFLPRKPRNSIICSAKSRRRMLITRPVSVRRSDIPEDIAPRKIARRWPIMPSLSACSSSGNWLACSSALSPVTLATKPFWADTAMIWSLGNCKISAVLRRCLSTLAATCAGVDSASHIVSILLSTTNRDEWSVLSVIRCSRQMARSDLVTPASAAKINTTACAWGIRLTVSSGSAPIAFKPGVSKITKPCFSKGCAMLISA